MWKEGEAKEKNEDKGGDYTGVYEIYGKRAKMRERFREER